MRRSILLIPAAALLLAVAGSAHRAAKALAISYPTGWNLISGPGGSTLSGNTGFLYTLQPGDSSYETLPPDSILRAGWGYWAYFPNGGTLHPGPDANSYTTVLNAGQWAMLGDPSSSEAATVSGASDVLIYTPDGGYQSSLLIQPGSGAFVSGSGAVTVALPGAPTPSLTPASNALGINALASVALQNEDLSGYKAYGPMAGLPSGGAVAIYSAAWRDLRPGTLHYTVAETLTSYNTVQGAATALTQLLLVERFNTQYIGVRDLGSAGIGDEDHEIGFTAPAPDVAGAVLDGYLVAFRHGNEVVSVVTLDAQGTGSLAVAVSYARLIDSRLAAVLGS
jgi:hypothetical protein